MYIILLIALISGSGWILLQGVRSKKRYLVSLGAGCLALGSLFFPFLDFWGEMLWFEALGQTQRFWTVVVTQALGVTLGAGLALALVRLATSGTQPWLRNIASVLAALIGSIWGLGVWEPTLLFLNGTQTGVRDPILGLDAAFYLFRLPLFQELQRLLLWSALLSLAFSLFAHVRVTRDRIHFPSLQRDPGAQGGLWRSSALMALALVWVALLSIFRLLYSEWGVVAGPGWTDVYVRLPALALVAILTSLLFLVTLFPFWRRRWGNSFGTALVGTWGTITIVWLVALLVIPILIQWLVVEPNEITFEKPYIAHNIEFTRKGFGLDRIEERQFPSQDELTPETLQENQALLSEVRLWDWRALDAVYKQFQEIRLYYEFFDVDIDRYQLGDRYRQVMVSPRELAPSNLPQQSQTFVNRRFKYTHGYGLTMATVSDFTPDGLPNLLIRDIPPQSEIADLSVEEPRIYYGELTREPVVVNSSEDEFDYPSGDENVYVQYRGSGGVRISNLWRKFVMGWKFDGTRFFLSSYTTPKSRILFRRQVRQRVKALAPFLEFDDDPYIVLEGGHLYWMLDGYTTSEYYPYSEPFRADEQIEYREGNRTRSLGSNTVDYLDGKNYVRNSVKVVVNAYEGWARFYVFDDNDPLIQAWARAFPGLFVSRAEMNPGLQTHIRYPADFLLMQGLVYSKYHMHDPEVFYNQEDLWVRATEKYYSQIQPVEPYYVMWQLPDSDDAEFVLILPFTPKNRQVLIGWIAGLCDPPNYGRFIAYKFPKEKRILGPQQVETKIDQDRFLSGQLTLWDQRGSNVIRGNVLAIPIGDTLLYVEPIYLQAETAAYPELRLVVAMQGDQISYAETFERALVGLIEGRPPSGDPLDVSQEEAWQVLATQANQAFERYLQLQAERQFEAAARELKRLEEILIRLHETGQASSESPPQDSQ